MRTHKFLQIKKRRQFVEKNLCSRVFLAEINCGSPGILYNGWLEGSRMTLHAVIEFHCIEGMTFEGENERTVCQSDGTWSTPFPKCHGLFVSQKK